MTFAMQAFQIPTGSMAETLRGRGVEMLDAPVSGGEKGAIDGALSIMVGGKAEAFARVRPLFEILGRNVVHVGDNGAGQVTKAYNQVVIAQTIAAVAEGLMLATASGVDPAKVRQALLECNGVEAADVDLKAGRAVASGPFVQAGTLAQAVRGLGYEVQVNESSRSQTQGASGDS